MAARLKEVMRIEARRVEDLHKITDAIHDNWFDVSEIQHDPENRAVTIPFENAARRARGAKASARYILAIREVVKLFVEESEGVGRYDFNKLEYAAASGRLTIHTGIPLVFYLEVGSIQISVSPVHGRGFQH